jgi:hypothetical protein
MCALLYITITAFQYLFCDKTVLQILQVRLHSIYGALINIFSLIYEKTGILGKLPSGINTFHVK